MNIILILLCGLTATFAMTVFMQWVHKAGYANADMVRAIGSLITKNYEKAFWPGVLIKFSTGALFGLLYAGVASVLPVPEITDSVLVIAMTSIGSFHGLAVGVLLTILVAEHHPLEQYRNAGGGVVLTHVLGHLVFGLVLGFLFAITDVNVNFYSSTVNA